ncbi:hypothetical protein MTR67_022181 [Solanum verrucosum]|uniref:Uncharacterized protein n=1 Tax=Solanum verrucosum TaxID=315347 RepID=A0AAF0QYF4_SOLVR|nr:hypothetical protein MTR67_022181 [Solanum verrucosum]
MEIEVKEFVVNGAWNVTKLLEYISPEMTAHIIDNIKPRQETEEIDRSWWMGNAKGTFTVKSAYHSLRSCRTEPEWMNYLWLKAEDSRSKSCGASAAKYARQKRISNK